jgi:hypothetical protein
VVGRETGIDLASLNSGRLTDQPTDGRMATAAGVDVHVDGCVAGRREVGAPGCQWPSRFMAAGAGATRTRTNPHGASGGARHGRPAELCNPPSLSATFTEHNDLIREVKGLFDLWPRAPHRA